MITVFGSINMDLIATANRLPRPGETVGGKDFSTAAGGKGANQALAAQRAGSQVRMGGAVGNDNFALPALAFLEAAGTDLRSVARTDVPTGIAMILVDSAGENMITVVPGANGTLTEQNASALVSTMQPGGLLMLQLEIPPAAVERALSEARARGLTTIINIAPLTSEAARLGRMADIVIANETEFERLAAQDGMGADEREQALLRLHRETGQIVIVTLGADGVIAIKDGALYRAKGLDITPVDTVGAGDTFCGYFAASLDQGMDFDTALKRAAVAGSLACLKHGAQPSIPKAEDVDAHV